jgi:hypothetical protein
MAQSNYQALVEKWGPILEHDSFSPIADQHKKSVTATILENTEKALVESGDISASMTGLLSETTVTGDGGFGSASTAAGPTAGYDPVLISLVRRAMPNLMAYDIAGVQPMTGPTGLIFAMRSTYTNQAGDEAFYNEADTDFSGTGAHANGLGAGSETTGVGLDTDDAEALGTLPIVGGTGVAGDPVAPTTSFGEMAFSIEKVTVAAKSRALKAEYTTELAQDLKAVHGLDAETELANILQSEILVEINRELVRTIYSNAVAGATATAAPGTFDLDVDANGRWSVEKFKGLMFQIEQEANAIAKGTRRGKGNIVICSSDVASALQMAGVLDYTPALNSNALSVDDTGNTFAGVLNGRYKVYIDPYAGANYLVVGYKGSSSFDAGIFYCPYVPLQMVRAVGENSFQPKIGFKTRYGMVSNPYAKGTTQGSGALDVNSNVYYRRVAIANLF